MSALISSTQNPLVKRIRRLRQKKYRLSEGSFYVEGLRLVLSALENEAPVETILYSSELLTSDRALQVVREQQAAGVHCVEVAPPVFTNLSQRQNPVGLGAIVSVKWADPDEMVHKGDEVLVALPDVADPGNLGAIIRTIDAVGASGLVLVGQTVDPFHPSAVKASMGSLFTTPVARLDSSRQMLDWAARFGLHTVATSAKAQLSFWRANYGYPALIILGSEGEGLSDEIVEASAQFVTIPMVGSATSLNLAIAAGVLLYEVRRSQLEQN